MNSDVARIIQSFEKKINLIKDQLAKGISQDLTIMLNNRVPIDTKTLQQEGLTVVYYSTSQGITIDCFVNSLQLNYGRQSIRAEALGLILDIGLRGGKPLLRTRSQPKNSARTPTSGWFTKDFKQDVVKYLEEKQYRKWLDG